eukprot:TRINITY_DN2382_c0_g1_i2.p1 TRINITY_DN2382_c0_g1~~TRINITY_DN2382_c0_g1_i2.p1  ORF type:complete len:529 (-),score=121.11 TRINITY_DN2382_c0_g1_i2:21-1607(-)
MEVPKYEYTTCFPQLSEDVQALCNQKIAQCESTRGWLTVHCINAKGLAIKDRMLGSSDPYIKLYCEAIEDAGALTTSPQIAKATSRYVWKSKTMKKNLNPNWNDLNVRLGPFKRSSNIKIDLWDYDTLMTDDYMGSCNFALVVVDVLQSVSKSNKIILTFTLSSRQKQESVKGTISLTLSWEEESSATALSSSGVITPAAEPAAEAEVAATEEEDEVNYQASESLKIKANLDFETDATMGKRATMEDKHVSFPNLRELFPSRFEELAKWKENTAPISFFGVYDGHGGKEVAEKLAEFLHQYFVESDAFAEGDIQGAFQQSFKRADTYLCEEAAKNNWTAGAVVVVAVLIGNTLYVANAGDSEILIGRNYTPLKGWQSVSSGDCSPSTKYRPVVLSRKHKPTDNDEKERIEKEGGIVFHGRVCGSLAVSRALGDHLFKPPVSDGYFVSGEPYVATPVVLKPQDSFMILGCDGLFDRMKYDDIASFVARKKLSGSTPKEISRLLLREAVRNDSSDNITATVVFFNWEVCN